MPRYNYICEKCTIGDYIKSKVDGLSIFIPIEADEKNFKKEQLVWEEIHGIQENPEIKCPICKNVCSRTFYGVKVAFLIPGTFLRDTMECKTLANIHRLETDDPYARHRVPGEKDHKITEFKKSLKRRSISKSDKLGNSLKAKEEKLRKSRKKIQIKGKKNTSIQ